MPLLSGFGAQPGLLKMGSLIGKARNTIADLESGLK
jgi:hypothetical protein